MSIEDKDRILILQKLDKKNTIIVEIFNTQDNEFIDMMLNINQIAELSRFLQDQLNAYAEANSPKITTQMIIDEYNKL